MATRVKKVARKRASSTRRSSKSMSKRAERVVKRLFVSPVENLTRRTALDVPPQTSLRQMEQDLDRASATLGRDEIAPLL